MSILFRWLFYGCLTRTVAAMAAMVAVYMIIEVFDKSRYLGQGFTAPLLLEYLLLKTPMVVAQFMPIILLIAMAIYVSEVSHHLEIVALRASGVGVKKIYAPILAVAVLAGATSFVLNEWVTPVTNQRLDVMERVYVHHKPEHSSRGVQWLKDEQRLMRLTPLTNQRFAFLMLEVGTDGRWMRRVEAAHATYAAGQWQMKDVYISMPDATDGFHLQHYVTWSMASAIGPGTAEASSPGHMQLLDLYHYASQLESAGLAANDYVFSLHKKITSPIACVIMGVLALSLCMHMGSRISATSMGMMSTIVIGLLFYVFGHTSGLLATADRLPAAYAAWLPNMVFAGLAGFLFLHKEGH